LEITPAFQRVFVWHEQQRSQFIESLLLELPIPPIYVIEQGDEGHYLLIDGLQRMSSYLHFRGCLTNQHKGIQPGEFLKLEGCDIVPALNGKVWADLDTALQIRLKRAFVSLQVIRKESLPDLKYHMFKRLNSGGSEISPQQIRNAYVRMLANGDRIMDFAHELAQIEAFKATCSAVLTDEQGDRQADEGFVLRFVALRNDLPNYVHDVDPFIDSFVESVARGPEHKGGRKFDFEKEKEIFTKTFQLLAASTKDLSFTYPNRGKLTAGFSSNHFEGVTLGLQPFLDRLDPADGGQMEALDRVLKEIRLGAAFRAVSAGGGRNSRGVLEKRVGIISEAVAKLFV
jgi:hypothetical protein